MKGPRLNAPSVRDERRLSLQNPELRPMRRCCASRICENPTPPARPPPRVARGRSSLPGETLAVMGNSGSGKSTLLHLVGALDHADGGEILLDGVNIAGLSESARASGAARDDRRRFPAVQPHLQPHRRGKSRLSGAAPGRLDPLWQLTLTRRLGLEDFSHGIPNSCPAASSSVSPSAGRWRRDRNSCWRMNRPAISTKRLATRCWRCRWNWSPKPVAPS